MPLVSKKLWTVDEVLHMQEAGILTPTSRLELIRGELIEMSPSGNLHAALVNDVFAQLLKLVAENAIVWGQTNVQLDIHSAPEPDIALLKYRKDRYFSRLPEPEDILLVIEISDSSLNLDRKIKAPLYAEFGIPEYWILDLAQNRVERYQQPGKDGFAQVEYFSTEVVLPLPELDAEISVGALFGVK
ncbi:MAG: Uma2 family endonuclease [Saprospirales bacterium]|nr:Uma2 family endonuclease [Saprospirales bacterium]